MLLHTCTYTVNALICNTDHNSQAERNASAGNIMAYIQAAQRGLRFLSYSDGVDISDVYDTLKCWLRDYDCKRQSQRGADSWEELSQKKRWLHWEEVIETVKKQKEAYELAPPGIRQARESVKYMVLLFYSCLPPGRAQEYRTLRFQRCDSSELRLVPPTPDDKTNNILFLSEDGRQAAIYIGSHKTSKSKGCQKISLDEFDYFIHHIHRYITKHRPLLIHQSKSPSHTYVFVVRHTHLHTHCSL